jgi:5-methylcytosine-specific restriction endonuclease McrA
MSISSQVRQEIRQRANFACEFCGVTELDTAGQLTIDHYQPKAKGGSDSPDNLIYSCSRCNQYKSDYWPMAETDLFLWNPRRELAKTHFLELETGHLHPLTDVGAFTIKRLRLNRDPLLRYRLRKKQDTETLRLLTRYGELIELLSQLNKQLSDLMIEQRDLLEEQREFLALLLKRSQD